MAVLRWILGTIIALLYLRTTVVVGTSTPGNCLSEVESLREMYLQTLKGSLTGILLETPSHADPFSATNNLIPYNHEARMGGKSFPAYGYTMIGMRRLDNLETLGIHLLKQNVRGDFFECGVWRGGASIFMRGFLKAYQCKDRTVHLVDSFEGLPKASTEEDSNAWATMELLKVPQETVEGHFQKYELLDDQVQFHKGFFRQSLPAVRQSMKERNGKISLLRMDGDMYESTMDILFNLVEFLSPGACIVVDDYCINECNKAVKKFLTVHDLSPNIHVIDTCGAYFCLEEEVAVEHSWYEQFNAKRGE